MLQGTSLKIRFAGKICRWACTVEWDEKSITVEMESIQSTPVRTLTAFLWGELGIDVFLNVLILYI